MSCLFWVLYYNKYKTHILVVALFLCFLDKSSHHHHQPILYPYWYPLYPTVPLLYPDCTPAVSSLYPYCILAVSSLYPDCILTVSSLYPYHYTLYYRVHDEWLFVFFHNIALYCKMFVCMLVC